MTEQISNWLSQLRAVNGFEFGSLNMDDADSERSGLAGFNYSKKPAPLPQAGELGQPLSRLPVPAVTSKTRGCQGHG